MPSHPLKSRNEEFYYEQFHPQVLENQKQLYEEATGLCEFFELLKTGEIDDHLMEDSCSQECYKYLSYEKNILNKTISFSTQEKIHIDLMLRIVGYKPCKIKTALPLNTQQYPEYEERLITCGDIFLYLIS